MGGRGGTRRRDTHKTNNSQRSATVPPSSPQRDPDATTMAVNVDLGRNAVGAAAAPATSLVTTTSPVDLTANVETGPNKEIYDNLNADILQGLQDQFQVLLDSGRAGQLNQDQPPAAAPVKETFPPHLALLVGQLVRETIMQVQPIIMSTVSHACSKILCTMLDHLKNIPAPVTAQPVGANSDLIHQDLRKQLRQPAYINDQREQDSRACTIKIKGVDFTEGEDLRQEVITTAGKAEVVIQNDDIVDCFRLGNNTTAPDKRPIIVKLANKGKKVALMRNKKKVGGNVFMEESLTRLRGKLFYKVRIDDKTLKTWTIEGKIFTKIKVNEEEVVKVITTPDDLTKIGWSDTQVSEFWDDFKNE